MGADTLANSTKGGATPDQGESRLFGAQRGGHQDATSNKGAGILDIPGDLVASRHTSGTTVGECTGRQASTLEFLEIFVGKQTVTG